MKIFVVSINTSVDNVLKNYFLWKKKRLFQMYGPITYPFLKHLGEEIGYGKYEENLIGVEVFVDEVISHDEYDVFLEFPFSFGLEKIYDKFINDKFIFININKEDWLKNMNDLVRYYSHEGQPYQFEKLFCNHYAITEKIKIQDLNDDELSNIYDKHLEFALNFFADKTNVLILEKDDPELLDKIDSYIS